MVNIPSYSIQHCTLSTSQHRGTSPWPMAPSTLLPEGITGLVNVYKKRWENDGKTMGKWWFIWKDHERSTMLLMGKSTISTGPCSMSLFVCLPEGSHLGTSYITGRFSIATFEYRYFVSARIFQEPPIHQFGGVPHIFRFSCINGTRMYPPISKLGVY